MKVLLLCGYFESVYQQEIANKTKTWVENAANTFQKRLISGLVEQQIELSIVSAPFIGPWPTAYSDIMFKGFQSENAEPEFDIEYVKFNNIWGYRNISRTRSLKKYAKEFVEIETMDKKVIIVYSPHTPFLEAAVYAKKKDPSIHICMIVPDLPQYMNLSKDKHPIYDFFKKIDIAKFYKLNEKVDSYMLLTKHMAEVLKVDKRPYIVVEGIADTERRIKRSHERGKRIAYAGKLVESFGIKRLIKAFELLKDKDASLEICGGGELREYIEEKCKADNRIHYHGVISAEEAQRILEESDVLVNPRLNDNEYTKYSFPSKNIEYLLTGKAVVAYMLDGIPEKYREFLYIPKDNSVEALSASIVEAMELSRGTKCMEKALVYLLEKRCAYAVGKQLLSLLKGKE